ncbi:hypothetical protein HPB50_024608 [Hyalomma asiaticum]|uniref:Uncharacterized protein n=1 Tax=Hyalomma asiaticum TaxID=266040 RepID=A0ACB7RL27_HYAAI|nr:hypothetical protein HPB50_024608 [Hyalomma asiaticum]
MGNKGSTEKKKNHPQGPHRHASEEGAFIQLLEFPGIYGYRDAVLKTRKVTYTKDHKCTLGGYTFAVRCRFEIDDDGDLAVGVALYLQAGQWDNTVTWPFAKKTRASVTHPRDHKKDIWLKVRLDEPPMTKKPEPGRWNQGRVSLFVKFQQLEHNGFIHNNKLYVNVELQ